MTASDYRFLLADFDGTLHNSVPSVERATNSVLKRRGYSTVDRRNIVEGMRLPTLERMLFHAGLYEGAVPGGQSLLLGEELGDEFYRELKEMLKLGILFDGIADTLGELSRGGIPMGIVSNNRRAMIETVLVQYGLTGKFGIILGEDSVETPKPSPEGILQCCALFGFSPEKGVYIGDSPTDSETARAAGMFSIGVSWNVDAREDVREFGFDHVTHHPGELFDFFRIPGGVKG